MIAQGSNAMLVCALAAALAAACGEREPAPPPRSAPTGARVIAVERLPVEPHPIDTDGSRVCWVRDGQAHCVGSDPIEPPLLDRVVGVALEVGEVCVWNDAGEARCRARIYETRRLVERDLDSAVLSINMSFGNSCARLPSTALSCWSFNGRGKWREGGGPAATDEFDVADRVCFVREGRVRCFGPNFVGEIGHGCATETCESTLIDEIRRAYDVAVGGSCTCVAHARGVSCWGCPTTFEELWFESALQTHETRWPTAQPIAGVPKDIVEFDGQGNIFCALDCGRALHCFQIATPDAPPPMWPSPTIVATAVDAFAVADCVVCVLRGAEVSCFGEGSPGLGFHAPLVENMPPPGRVFSGP